MKRSVLTGLFLLLSVLGFSQGVTNVGTDFWIAFPPNWQSGALIELFISSNYSTSGTVSSAYPGVNQNFSVTPGVVTQLTLPSGVVLQGGIEDKGIHVMSNDPISLYGLNNFPYATDAYLALPIIALGLDYRIITYNSASSGMGSNFSVVATQDGTTLTVFNHQTNSTNNVNLNQGQTYHVQSSNTGDDVTGSRVQSNFPVAVFGSAPVASVPAGCATSDHIVEQMFPYYSWGKNFVTIPLAGRDASGDIFRILAGEDGTDISINGILVSTINTGSFYEANLAGNNSITTSKATMLAQFAKGKFCSGGITGDPLMILIPPREQFLTNYTICNVAGFASHWVNVVAPDYALGTIYQDGVLIPIAAFTQIGTTNFYGAQRPVTEGSHTFTSTIPFGVFVYGWNLSDSYGYPGGCSLSPVGTVNSVTLSPPTATGILDVSTLCFTAHVEDNLLTPVAGVLVTFNISGISNITGTAYTDASGNAQYCYARTGTTTGNDNIYAECFGYNSDTSIATWILSCTNPTSSGSIGNSQAGCGSYVPISLTSITLPSGQAGTLEFKWQQSTTSGVAGFSDISASNAPGYSPGPISQTTWYRRLARVDCMPDWTGAVMTEALEMTVTTPQIPFVTISANHILVCAGETVTFTATPINGGTNPAYQWKVNGVNAGTNSSIYSYIPASGDCIICQLTSSIPCVIANPATSNEICYIVFNILPVSVTISSSANPVCQGNSVTFTASPTNGGAAPVYQWYNGLTPVGSNSDTYSYVPVNGDMITVVMTSNAGPCLTGSPATSNAVTMTVNPILIASVTIAADANPVCAGTSVKFTAMPVNGGVTPVYQWYKGLAPVGSNSNTYSYIPVNGDVITVVMTSTPAPCLTGSPATSNAVTMTVNPILSAGLTIAASANPVCAGISVTFTATPDNGGTSPAYQWKVNGGIAGSNSPNFSYIPQTGDSIRCLMTSNLACVTNNPASSNKIVMTASSVPVVTFTLCFDSITTINANPIKLKGGIPLGGTYSGPGVNSVTGVFTPSVAGIGTKTITYSYTNVALCSASKTKTIIVQSAPAFTCGNNLTDIRDGKVYTTLQIGSQCWMASNLNYGTMILSASHQRDNCVPEKYCYNELTANCEQRGANYQWDELLRYDDTPGLQGLCPPGWHVPTEAEWNTLFANWTNNAFAGAPLKYSGYSGFNALLSGVRHLNVQWDYQNVATFFWSSTSNGPMKAWSHGLNDYNYSVSCYSSFRTNAYSVRCLKDF
jgi:uncharacterized protein (TIGR02145 family)